MYPSLGAMLSDARCESVWAWSISKSSTECTVSIPPTIALMVSIVRGIFDRLFAASAL